MAHHCTDCNETHPPGPCPFWVARDRIAALMPADAREHFLAYPPGHDNQDRTIAEQLMGCFASAYGENSDEWIAQWLTEEYQTMECRCHECNACFGRIERLGQ